MNCLQSLFLTDGDRFITTPTYHVFEMYAPHSGAQAVRTECGASPITYDRVPANGTVTGLAGSTSVNDRTLTLTVVNTHATDPFDTTITVRGGRVNTAQAVTLGARDIHAHNTFERPSDVVPGPAAALTSGTGGALTHRFPPASVTRVTVTLG